VHFVGLFCVSVKFAVGEATKTQRRSSGADLHWVRDLTVSMHLGLNWN